eukprot:379589_1
MLDLLVIALAQCEFAGWNASHFALTRALTVDYNTHWWTFDSLESMAPCDWINRYTYMPDLRIEIAQCKAMAESVFWIDGRISLRQYCGLWCMASPSTENDEQDEKEEKPKFIINNQIQLFNYAPSYLRRNQIIISKSLTYRISNCIREHIENIYDFIGKLTAIAEYDGTVVVTHNRTAKLFNCGFHDKHSDEVVYLVAIANKTVMENQMPMRTQRSLYVLNNATYTQRQLYNMYKLHQRPKSWYEDNNITHITRKVNEIFLSTDTRRQIIHKTKWHKMRVFHPQTKMQIKEYNKRRVTFSISKTEFIDTFTHFVDNERGVKPLIPIIMFATADNGYRVEYIQFVSIREDSDIGISYVYNHRKNTIQPSGIHLNKNNILHQHQLADPHHDCHCLDEFRSIIDDLHIGNPDQHLNQCKDLQNRLTMKQSHDLRLAQQAQMQQLQQQVETLETMDKQHQALVQALQSEVMSLRRARLLHQPLPPIPAASIIPMQTAPPYSGTRPTSYLSPSFQPTPPMASVTSQSYPSTVSSTPSSQQSYREGLVSARNMTSVSSQCFSEGYTTNAFISSGECGAIERIQMALTYYENIDEKQTDDGHLVHVCNSIYKSLLEDWIHVMAEHAKDTKRLFPCKPHDILYCRIANRHYFNTMVHDINDETDFIFYKELLDSIHCY